MNQTPEIYLENTNNIFHQLRGYFLAINQLHHNDFIAPEIEPVVSAEQKKEKAVVRDDDIVVVKKPLQLNILEARMQKMQYQKMRKKGGQTEEEKAPNLQTQSNTNGYYSMDFLWDKLAQNDVIREESEKLLNWNKLDDNMQKQKLRDFLDKFKPDMEIEIWKEMAKDVMHKRKILNIIWHKQSQKIMEIEKLIINPSCFYWDS